MAYTQHIHLFLFFLALTACLEIRFTQGRQLKVLNEHKDNAKEAANIAQSPGSRKDSLKGIGQKKVSPPVIPTQRHELSNSEVSHTDTFQPTTPGNSPGVGHYFAGQKQNTEVKVQHFTTLVGKTDGFQPTTPGHSPGVGHSIGN